MVISTKYLSWYAIVFCAVLSNIILGTYTLLKNTPVFIIPFETTHIYVIDRFEQLILLML